MVMYADLERTARMAAGIGMNYRHPFGRNGSISCSKRWMASSIEIGVVPGRISPVLGTIDNEDVVSMVAASSKRLVGFTSVNPVDRRQAIAAISAI